MIKEIALPKSRFLEGCDAVFYDTVLNRDGTQKCYPAKIESHLRDYHEQDPEDLTLCVADYQGPAVYCVLGKHPRGGDILVQKFLRDHINGVEKFFQLGPHGVGGSEIERPNTEGMGGKWYRCFVIAPSTEQPESTLPANVLREKIPVVPLRIDFTQSKGSKARVVHLDNVRHEGDCQSGRNTVIMRYFTFMPEPVAAASELAATEEKRGPGRPSKNKE